MNTKNQRVLTGLLCLALAIALPLFAQAQKTKAVESRHSSLSSSVSIEDHKLSSKLMVREMPYRVILPASYAVEKEAHFPVFYLLHGLTGHYDNWDSKTKIAEYAAPYNAIIVMPEGENGWYTDSATRPNDRYETYIIQELIPEIDKRFRTIRQREGRLVAGLSMGGYGSIKFGLKYPEMFVLVGSFSGALGAASWSDKTLGGSNWIASSIMSVYGAEGSQTRQENDIFKIVREISPEKIKSLPFIYLDCGTEDFLIQNNRDFSGLLFEKKIPHEFRQLPGAHTWNYWDRQVQEFLRLTERFLNQAKAKTT
jgi:putative tributyrin esterase